MRIAIDIRPLQDPKYSGVSEYTLQLLTHLFDIDQTNQYFLFYNAVGKKDRNIPKIIRPNVVYKEFKYPNKLLNLSLSFFGRPYLDELVGGADLVFFPNVNFGSVSKKAKTIITIHDLSFVRHPEFFDFKTRLWHAFINPYKMATRADHILSVSEHTKWDCEQLYKIPSEKITVTHLGVNNNFQRVTDQSILTSIREKYKLPEKFLLYLGTVEPRKNIISIIESLRDVKHDYPLVIAGKNGWKSAETLKVAEENKGCIKLIDYVEAKDKPALYTLATVFVWPSFYEGFGLPPLEAQACGTPVIAGANSSMLETMKDSAILVNADNVHEISQAINLLLADEKLREYYIQKGVANASRFTWEETAKRTLEAFEMTNDKNQMTKNTQIPNPNHQPTSQS